MRKPPETMQLRFKPTAMAHREGYDQILWTDAVEHKYIEESGTMNVVFVLNGKLGVTFCGRHCIVGCHPRFCVAAWLPTRAMKSRKGKWRWPN